MAQQTMYNGYVNSIPTTITNSISNTDTIIYVLDDTRIPDAPNLLVLGTDASAETVRLTGKTGNMLTVERAFQGSAKSWASGTVIARNFTEYDHRVFKENIEDVNTQLAQKVSKAGDTMTGNLNVPSINSKTPAYAIAPTETIITTGFATGWGGSVKVQKNQEGLNIIYIYLTKTTDILDVGEVVLILPIGVRPGLTFRFVSDALNSGGSPFYNNQVSVFIENNGNVIVQPTRVSMGARMLYGVTAAYYKGV